MKLGFTRRLCAAAFLLLACTFVAAADPVPRGKLTITVLLPGGEKGKMVPGGGGGRKAADAVVGNRDTIITLKADGVDPAAAVRWRYDATKLSVVNGPTEDTLYVTGPPGDYAIEIETLLWVEKAKPKWESSQLTLTIKDKTPPQPVPPTPKPDDPPVPPAPKPDDPKAPFAGMAGLRMLIVEESADRTKLPSEQQRILFSKVFRDYLRSKSPLGADGKTYEFRIWDKDTDASADAKTWQDALSRAKATKDFKTPWIMVGNGKEGFEGPLPTKFDDALALVKKYGG